MSSFIGALGFLLGNEIGMNGNTTAGEASTEISNQVMELINSYVIPLLLTVATAILIIFGIINGIRLAKASTDEEKTKAKKNLIGIVFGAVVCVASIWLIPLIINIALGVFPTTGLVGFHN